MLASCPLRALLPALRRAHSQLITRRGNAVTVLLTAAAYRRATLRRTPISRFFRESPLMDSGIELTRDDSPLRDDVVL